LFDVIDQDVSGVTVKLVKGASLSGVIVLENEDKTSFSKLRQMQLQAYVASASGGSGVSRSSAISPDGSFRLAGLSQGTANIVLNATMGPNPNKGFTITRIERDGLATTRGIDIKEGEQVTGLRVIVSYGTATIRGVVSFENGSIPEGARMFVRLTKPGSALPPVSFTQVDARGHFLLEGIPTGVYELSMTVPAGGTRRSRTVKRDVSVQDGTVTDVSLAIDLAETPKP